MLYVLRAISLCGIALALMTAGTSAAPSASVVVVYPLTTTGTADAHVGEQIASLIGGALRATGSVEIREPSPAVSREDYLATARRLGADYYLSGFVSKVSGQLSVVEQLVSTLSDTTVWSNNARLVTTDDARAQSDLVLGAILGHAGRALSAFDPLPKPAPRKGAPDTPPAAPPARVAVLPIPSEAPVPVAAAKPYFAILLTGGSASEKNRAYTDAAIVKALRARGFLADVVNDPVGDLSILGPAICASTGAQLLLGGKVALEVQPDREINQWATAKLDMEGYDCAKSRSLGVHSADAESFNWNWALDQAVAAALKYPAYT